ncbi:MAG: hypothetical protein F6J87_11115 [Spirulina sp. SIO3F2]|nr:hypothetical protein [Spirulina sp. SIO3F2]
MSDLKIPGKLHTCFFEGYNLIEYMVSSNSPKVDTILLCQHGFRDDDFRNHFFEHTNMFGEHSQELVNLYLDLEYDFGAQSTTIHLARKISSKLRVLAIFVNCDRSIMDSNRIAKDCIDEIAINYIDSEKVAQLRKMNFFVRETILNLCRQYLEPEGFIIDVHSMWPFSFEPEIKKGSDIRSYCQSFLEPNAKREGRNINFILNEKDEQGMFSPVADLSLALSLKKSLQDAEYCVDEDKPYFMESRRSNYEYFKLYRGIAIDIPRNLLGSNLPKTANPLDYSLIIEDMSKIISMSDAMAKGIFSFHNVNNR